MARESCHRVTDSNARAVVDTQSRWERLDQSHPTVIGLPLQCNDSVCSVTDRLSLLSHRQTWRLTQAPSHGVCLLSHRQTWRLTQAPSHGVPGASETITLRVAVQGSSAALSGALSLIECLTSLPCWLT